MIVMCLCGHDSAHHGPGPFYPCETHDCGCTMFIPPPPTDLLKRGSKR